MGELANLFRAAQMLSHLLWSQPHTAPEPRRRQTDQATEYDIYEPTGTIHATLILVYGFTYAGERDGRLIRFVHSLLASGMRIIVPVLPGLKSFSMETADLHRMTDLIQTTYDLYGSPLRVIAFSIGAGMTLVTAAQPHLAAKIDMLFLFAPYYSLEDVWRRLLALPKPPKEDKVAWQSFIWTQLALAYRQLNQLTLTPAEREQMLHILAHYHTAKPEAEAFYDRVLQYQALPDPNTLSLPNEILQQMTPAGKLKQVLARVFIVHDLSDVSVPASHSEQIMAELNTRSQNIEGRLLITPLLAHIHPHFSLHLFDIAPLLRMFSALLA